MKSHTTENFLPAEPGFHREREDGLYDPVRFVFVNDRMREHILNERRAILDALPPFNRVRQEKIFSKYDPNERNRSFQNILRMYGRAANV
ncbi:hypothetical protein [Aromatoleum petrolei]|uniref:Uncharacterized protein n=1 Tax=Aromatoleum petrolei TaxID=76116 RepID=A0ABX1MLK8_9RHOO|nr:hypothetical protein [Aromatoleum petrolei]NMF87538.1 hypothetical protein [Aromatoleum petrolei]QTQ38635.1 hypothetical protein ToN1_45390 [Aromatoleum petrolei]